MFKVNNKDIFICYFLVNFEHIYLFIYLFIYSFIHLFIYLFIYLFLTGEKKVNLELK